MIIFLIDGAKIIFFLKYTLWQKKALKELLYRTFLISKIIQKEETHFSKYRYYGFSRLSL